MKMKIRISDFRFQISNVKQDLSCLICLLLIVNFFSSCGNEDDENTIAPKPRAYYRLSFPEKKYVLYDSACPFKFQIPSYSSMGKDAHSGAEPCWLNLNINPLNATIHLSYKQVSNNLNDYLEDTYTLASKHQIKASGIEETVIKMDSKKVYGLVYEIGGNAASSIQFFLTDSTRHFLRGALYFNAVPNTDSIKPALEFVREDIYNMIKTFEWKESSIPVSKPAK
jgi:gliding motility-associated lipoprotein GldD